MTTSGRGSTHTLSLSHFAPNGVALRKPELSASTASNTRGTVIRQPLSCGP